MPSIITDKAIVTATDQAQIPVALKQRSVKPGQEMGRRLDLLRPLFHMDGSYYEKLFTISFVRHDDDERRKTNLIEREKQYYSRREKLINIRILLLF